MNKTNRNNRTFPQRIQARAMATATPIEEIDASELAKVSGAGRGTAPKVTRYQMSSGAEFLHPDYD